MAVEHLLLDRLVNPASDRAVKRPPHADLWASYLRERLASAEALAREWLESPAALYNALTKGTVDRVEWAKDQGICERQFFRDLATIRKAGIYVEGNHARYWLVTSRHCTEPTPESAKIEPKPKPKRAERQGPIIARDVLHMLPCLPITAKASHIAVDLGVTVREVVDAVDRLQDNHLIDMSDAIDPELGLWRESYEAVMAGQMIGGAA